MTDLRDPRICLVSGADEIRLRSYINHVIYAREHGFDYRLECGLAEGITNKFFYKSRTVERLLPTVDWLVWLDDDVYFTQFARDGLRPLIEQAERDDHYLVIAEGAVEPRGFASFINTGVFLLRNDPRSFRLLELMHSAPLDEVRAWWTPELGVFTNGDQDLMTWALKTTDLGDGARIVAPVLLNSRSHLYPNSIHDAFICHFAGHFDKELSVARFGKRFGLGQELVPRELLDKYRVRVRDPLSPLQLRYRMARQRLAARLKPYLRETVRRMRRRREQRMGFDAP